MLTIMRAVRRRHGSRGQSMVEFALLSPVFFLMIMGLTDAARAVYDYNVISNASREGVREAVLAYNQCANNNSATPANWQCGATPPSGASLVGVDNAITRAGASIVGFTPVTDGTLPTSTAPSCTPAANKGCVWVFIVNNTGAPGGCTPPNPPPGGTDGWTACDFNADKRNGNFDVVVEIEFNFAPLTPLVGSVMGKSTKLWAKSEMRTEY
jgi:hypothetical protein